ncbi:hypothetical protein KIH27_21815 [Mycobacterium sp. M1]|uniref:PE-PGRS family protein n=1 Tax=Mycolicibacter acidiphilus TaxID=2835306 RepID=A0ABS5RTE1_9MYCO|nr:hypothetical protein [Mycolicibacter acidiphilus]MBS9536224.1 hypothetical protein [Mycolicibacter acidiphilus]
MLVVRQVGTGIGLTGAAMAAAAMIGLGAAHAAPAGDVVEVVPSGADAGSGAGALGPYVTMWDQAAQQALASGSPADLLTTATTNFTDAGNVFSGVDVSGLSGQVQQNATALIDSQTKIVGSVVNYLDDHVGPAESAISAHSGSLSSLADQLFLDPLNQQWIDAGEALLNAGHAFDTAVTDGSTADMGSALLQTFGVDLFQIVPTIFESIPVLSLGGVLGDAAGDAAAVTPDLLDFPF